MRRRLLPFALLAALAATEALAAVSGRAPVPIGIVPFVDAAGQREAVETATALFARELRARGFEPRGGDVVERYLREGRIRARDAMSGAEAAGLARQLDVSYLLFGSVRAWSMDGGPQVGLSVRIFDASKGATVWSASTSLDAAGGKGLLTASSPKTLADAAEKASRILLASLRLDRNGSAIVPVKPRGLPGRSHLAEAPIHFSAPRPATGATLRIAVLPFSNRTLAPDGPGIVAQHVTAWLLRMPGIEVVEPGEVRRALIERGIQLARGIGPAELAALRDDLRLDAVLEGSLLAFEHRGAAPPRIDLYAQLRDTTTGKEIWSATTARDGDETRSIYGIGRIRGLDRLAEATVGDLLSTWKR